MDFIKHNTQGTVPNKVILISGIPFDYTEDQIVDIARSVGPVVTSKLLFDKETGRSKGLCIIEYQDIETAASAVRNLNHYMLSGSDDNRSNRTLKCSFIDQNSIRRLIESQNGNNNGNGGSNNMGIGSGNGKLISGNKSGIQIGGFMSELDRDANLEKQIPPLPMGVIVEDSSMDGLNNLIYNTLIGLDSNRLKNLVKDAKAMSQEFPELMRVLLKNNPQLIYSLIQSTMLLNLAQPDDIKEVLIEQPETESILDSSTNNATNLETNQEAANLSINTNVNSNSNSNTNTNTNTNANTNANTNTNKNTNTNISTNTDAHQNTNTNTNGTNDAGMNEEQMNAIKAICLMSDEDITNSVTDIQQQTLYREIKQRYGNMFE